MGVITYPCWYLSYFMSVKVATGVCTILTLFIILYVSAFSSYCLEWSFMNLDYLFYIITQVG